MDFSIEVLSSFQFILFVNPIQYLQSQIIHFLVLDLLIFAPISPLLQPHFQTLFMLIFYCISLALAYYFSII